MLRVQGQRRQQGCLLLPAWCLVEGDLSHGAAVDDGASQDALFGPCRCFVVAGSGPSEAC